MMQASRIPVIACSAMMAMTVAIDADDRDDAADLVLGTTIMLRPDGSMVRLSERDALSAPWTGTASGITIGNEQGCAVAWPLAAPPRAISQALWLSDGQCLPGAPEPGEAPEPGAIRWRAGPMVLSLPLSSLRAWTAVGVDVPTGSIDADRITLRNGDTVDGLVTGFGPTVTIDVDGTVRAFDDELIASVQFVQAGDAPPNPGRLRVWVDDGAIIDADSIQRDGTILRLKVPMPSKERPFQLRLRIDQVLGMATPMLSRNGLALRGQDKTESQPPGNLPGITQGIELVGPGRLGSMRALLHGPGSWSMPISAAGVLVGDVRVPDRARSIADHAIVVRQDGVELARIGARSDVRWLRVAVKPGTVEFALVPGKAGPVGCVMELSDLVFISAAP